MIIIKCINIPGEVEEGVNLDIVGVNTRAAWVIDGATPLTAVKPRKAVELTREFAERLGSILSGHLLDEVYSLKEIVEFAHRKLVEEYGSKGSLRGLPLHAYPSASLAVIRYDSKAERIEYAVIGDCVVIEKQGIISL